MERKTNSFPFAFLGNAVGERGTVCPQKVLCANQEAYEIEQLTISLSTDSETMGKNTVSGSATSLKRIF